LRRAPAKAPKPWHVPVAREVLALIEAQLHLARRAEQGSPLHARALHSALVALGMRAALARDRSARPLLRELDTLESELAAVAGRASLAEFRALLAQRFEQIAFVDTGIKLAGRDGVARRRSLAPVRCRAADRRRCATFAAGAGGIPVPVERRPRRAGPATAESAQRAQAAQVASLFATVPRVVATWRRRHGDEPNALSPLLERLQFVALRAAGDDLLRPSERTEFNIISL